jgi:FixJ family two-component response regulator
MPDRMPVRATRNGGLDFIEVPTAAENLVAALRRERAGYVMRGLKDRVAAVDAELRRLLPPAQAPQKTKNRSQ